MKNENGAGSVYKLSGKRRKPWIARITTGYDKDGKQLRKTIGTYATKREGQEALIQYNKNPLLFNDITFKELKKMWWNSKKGTYKNEKTISTAKYKMNLLEPLNDLKITDITLFAMQKLFDSLKDKSYNYRSGTKGILKMIMDYAYKNDLITENKVNFIELGKKEKVIKRRIFTDWEIKTLWANLEDKKGCKKYIYIVLILIYTGLRIGELLNLKTEDIDLQNATLKIQESKTNAGKRTIPIATKILPLFKEKLNTEQKYFIKGVQGEQLKYPTFHIGFHKLMKELGIERHTIHDTRHTFATLLNNVEANKTSIIRLVGHTDFNTTESIYTHKSVEELRKAVELLN